MARHLSALKRARQNEKRRLRNQSRKTRVKNVVRQVRQAVAQKNAEEAQAALQSAIPTIARVAGKGTLHWRAAARKISRLTRQVNALLSEAVSSKSSFGWSRQELFHLCSLLLTASLRSTILSPRSHLQQGPLQPQPGLAGAGLQLQIDLVQHGTGGCAEPPREASACCARLFTFHGAG